MNFLFIPLQAAQAAAPAGGSTAGFWIMIILIFVVMWAFMIRPQRKKKIEEQTQVPKGFEEYQEMVNNSAREDHYRMTKYKLSELQRLYEEGGLTQEEYQKAKAKLLDEI